jgi:4-amino-4-deoxy-L-arabinose transferase-like glycosyltransferase
MLGRLARRGPLLAAVALFLLAAQHRVPNTDEGYFANASLNLARHGFLGTTNIEPSGLGLLRIEQRTYWVMPLLLLLQAAWFLVVPPTAFATRLLSVALAPLALLVFRSLVRRLTADQTVAVVATALLACDYMFLYAGSAARPELLCLTLGLGGLAAYLRFRECSLAGAVAGAGALIGLSLLTHPNGVLYLLVLAVFLLLEDRDRLAPRHLAVVGLVLGLLLSLWGLYGMQDPEAFRAQIVGNSTDRWPSSWNPLRLLARELAERYGPAYGFLSDHPLALLKAPALAAYLAGVVFLAASLRRRALVGAVPALAAVAAVFALQAVFNQKLVIYLIHMSPWLATCLALAAVAGWRRRPGARLLLVMPLLALMALQAGGFAYMTLLRSAPARQAEVASLLRSVAGEARLVFASSSWAFATAFGRRHCGGRVLAAPLAELAAQRPGDAAPDRSSVERLLQDLQGRRPRAVCSAGPHR